MGENAPQQNTEHFPGTVVIVFAIYDYCAVKN